MSGDIAVILILILRLVVPFSLFRWPLAGIFLCIAADASDVMILQATGYGFLDGGYYHHFDKIADIYYLFFAWLVARKWDDPLARGTATFWFWWRMAGVAAFELTGWRPIFLIAPSIFENFYIARLVITKFKPSFRFRPSTLIVILLLVGIPKIVQEYIMHFAYIDQTWTFIREHFFWWLYE
ncbi:hypothetical protein C4552_04190 [Candidatus Parcubacteria bacterium]|nr:MAG: hypothetical protein C4552_04190 [Candidatus Parcubacteria bacterium]